MSRSRISATASSTNEDSLVRTRLARCLAATVSQVKVPWLA